MIFPLLVTLVLLALSTLRLYCLTRRDRSSHRAHGAPTHLLIVLGSGGHTAEMLAALRNLDTSKYTHRTYLVSSGDAFSALKAKEFEHGLKDRARNRNNMVVSKTAGSEGRGCYGAFDIALVPRARRIHQSLLTTPFSSIRCLYACFSVLRRPHLSTSKMSHQEDLTYPDIILSNGPATAVIVIVASLIVRFLRFPGSQNRMRTVYIESWARVKKLSLSGKVLVHIVDRFLVQWEGLLEATNGKGEYLGVLV